MRRSRRAHLGQRFVQVAGGDAGDLVGGAGDVDSAFAHGDVGQFRLKMRLIPPGFSSGLTKALEAGGVHLTRKVHSEPGRVVVVEFRRNLGPLLIAAIIAAAVALFLILSWVLLKAAGGVADSIGENPLFWAAAALGVYLVATGNRKGRKAR